MQTFYIEVRTLPCRLKRPDQADGRVAAADGADVHRKREAYDGIQPVREGEDEQYRYADDNGEVRVQHLEKLCETLMSTKSVIDMHKYSYLKLRVY